MRRAEYTIELHSRGGPYKAIKFEGTRREAREFGHTVAKTEDNAGVRIHFHRHI